MRKSKRSKSMKRSQKVKRSKTRTKQSKKTKKSKRGKKGMNAFMKAKEAARKRGDTTFTYNGTTYKQAKTKTGMVIYKKA